MLALIPPHIGFGALAEFAKAHGCVLRIDHSKNMIVFDDPKAKPAGRCSQRPGPGEYYLHDAAKSWGIGPHKLYRALRDLHVMDDRNRPYKQFIDAKFFRIYTREWKYPNSTDPQTYYGAYITDAGCAALRPRVLAHLGLTAQETTP